MLSHDFAETPTRSKNGDIETLLRCKYCMRTPAKAREDGCPVYELTEAGQILLSVWNPEGVAYFEGRVCVTCERSIMGHWLRKGSDAYWCDYACSQESQGVSGCVTEISDVAVPVEQTGTKN